MQHLPMRVQVFMERAIWRHLSHRKYLERQIVVVKTMDQQE